MTSNDSGPRPPGATRRLGRSRPFSTDTVPDRLRQWHAPRANRWECLHVLEGRLDIEWLDAAGTTPVALAVGSRTWVAPGRRWRLKSLVSDSRFELEVHADETTAPAAPQPRRAALLETTPVLGISRPDDLAKAVAIIPPGSHCLLRAGFNFTAGMKAAMEAAGACLAWHPLAIGTNDSAAVVVRTVRPDSLAEYLGRDHAIIESALAGALSGKAEQLVWLKWLLARHLDIEENLLFPAYLEAGGREGWINGLLNEHDKLRQQLPTFRANADTRRRFLLLLDAHDEKEEQVVYPDIRRLLAPASRQLLPTLVHYPAVTPG